MWFKALSFGNCSILYEVSELQPGLFPSPTSLLLEDPVFLPAAAERPLSGPAEWTGTSHLTTMSLISSPWGRYEDKVWQCIPIYQHSADNSDNSHFQTMWSAMFHLRKYDTYTWKHMHGHACVCTNTLAHTHIPNPYFQCLTGWMLASCLL